MKKIAYFFAILVAAVACSINEPIVATQYSEASEGQIEVVVGISVPTNNPLTRAMDSIPGTTGIRNLYAAVFDDAGYLCQYVKAECVEGYPQYNSATADANAKPYKLIFDVSKTKPRIVHFIANGPENVKFGTEETVIASMVAHRNPGEGEIGPDVYWQRILLPEGINFDPELDADGKKQLVLSSADSLRNVGLVRNFAQFHISSTATNFELVEAKILMAPDVSYVAAYNKTKGNFVKNYALCNVSELLAEGYIGSAPATAKVLADFSNPTHVDAYGKISEFMFEREKPTSAPACVIVGGKYNGSPTVTYYKVNLLDHETGDYYPIMRNFNYVVTVNAVGAAGKATMEEAYNTSGSGDISTLFEFSDLASVSNGISQIQVQYTGKVVVSDESFGLKYKFIPDVNTTVETVNNNYHIVPNKAAIPTDPELGVYIYIDEPDALGAAINSISVMDSDDPTDKTRTIIINPVEPSATQKTQNIVIIGVAEKDGSKVFITRSVEITVHNTFNFSISCPQEVPATKETPVDVTIKLPARLRQSMFPLLFNIEAEKLSIAPAGLDNLPVESGVSSFDATKPGYHFVKTISWEEYYHGDGVTLKDSDFTTDFVCHFKTNTAQSGTVIMASNGYFGDALTYFTNPGQPLTLKFTPLTYSQNGSSNVDLSFQMLNTDQVTVTLQNLVPADDETRLVQTGSGVYTFTPATAGSQTIHLKLSSAGVDSFKTTLASTNYVTASKKSAPGILISLPAEWHEDDAVVSGTTHAPAVGFESTITAYVHFGQDANRNVKFYLAGQEYTPAQYGHIEIDGIDYHVYLLDYTPTAPGYQTFRVEAWNTGAESAKKVLERTGTNGLGVYYFDPTLSLGSPLTSASFNTSTNYVLKNYRYNTYLSRNGNNVSVTSDGALTNAKYFRFASTSSPSKIQNVGNSRYLRFNSDDLSYTNNNSNATSLTIDGYSATKGFQINYKQGSFYYRRYLYQSNSTSVGLQQADTYQDSGTYDGDDSYWIIYPVIEGRWIAPTL